MKRLLFSCLLAVAALAGTALPPISIEQLVFISTHQYITLENEEADVQVAMDFYDKIFTDAGFTNGLTGEGYGGPCSILDGYYYGGYADTENYAFVPTDNDDACVVEITACNDGEDSDYGYPEVSVSVFSKFAADVLLRQLDKNFGWEKVEVDTDEDSECSLAFQRENVTVYFANYGSHYWFNISASK